MSADDFLIIGQILGFMITLIAAYISFLYADSINPKLDESAPLARESGVDCANTARPALDSGKLRRDCLAGSGADNVPT